MNLLRHRGLRPGSARRLFTAYVVVTLVPVLILGGVLVAVLQREGDTRGLAEGRAKADLLARSAIAPLLGQADLRQGLTFGERSNLSRSAASAIADQQVLRLRLRDLDGTIVYSDDQSGGGTDTGDDDEALDAARGETVSELTWLNADADDHGPRGARVVEVYQPLLAQQSGRRIGVLEMYVPYAPIEGDIAHGQRTVLVVIGLGLLLLWLCLMCVTASMVRRMRRQFAANAYLASHDVLTGLANRGEFRQAVSRAVDRAGSGARPGEWTGVALLNVDRFRSVNDALGHANGDELIRQLAVRISAIHDCYVARLAGDEFGVILTAPADADIAQSRLEELRTALTEQFEVGGFPLAVELSVGFALASSDQADAASLLLQADIALAVAKREHRGVVRYDATQDDYDASALVLLAELRDAIASNQLRLHLQPKVDLVTGTVSAVEALVRWQHPTRGLLSPQAFLPAVEQTQLIDELTRWVLREACRLLPGLDPSGHLAVAVNISARSLVRLDFVDEVLQVLQEADVAPHRIVLEITETAILADPARATSMLGRLHAAGLKISIDDFGAGQTSLGYLAMMEIDELKVDQAFVFSMTTNPRNAAIVRSVIELGHSLGFSVTAEGVETREVLELLRTWGCDTVQGYFLSRPVTADKLPSRIVDLQWLRLPSVAALVADR